MKRKRQPTSVGEMLKEEFLVPLGLTQREFADHIGVEIKAVNRLINNKVSLTPLMAMKISSALGTTPDFWMKLHFGNEIWKIENSKIDLPEKISA